MSTVFDKLNLKQQTEILVINAPESFQPQLDELQGVSIRKDLQDIRDITFSLSFVTKKEEVDALSRKIAPQAKGDALVWFAYPKTSSKKYKCEFNRDTGWDVLGELGFEPVRQVAIDEDWSALRFRRVEFIKTMMRDKKMALTSQGKERAK